MCGLFGFTYYGKDKMPRGLQTLTESLAVASSVRGTDATGISYIGQRGKLNIIKKDVGAYDFKFKLPECTRAVMGHTRRTTQGNEQVNRNNHPFPGSVGKRKFALAHNGVLDNEFDVKNRFNLPPTKVETDSYVAVQLIEHFGTLDHDTFKQVGENVEGMFAFTILDQKNNLHIIRNDSPLSILHFKKLQMYVYASTESILLEAVANSSLTCNALWSGLSSSNDIEILEPGEGSIWTIQNNGEIITSDFEPQDRWGYNPLYSVAGGGGYGYSGSSSYFGEKLDAFHSKATSPLSDEDATTYMDILISELEKAGHTVDTLHMLLEEGYTTDDIEDAIYCDYVDYLVQQCNIKCAEEVTEYITIKEDTK